MGVKKINKVKLMEVAEVSCAQGDTIHNMPFEVTAKPIYAALLTAHQLDKQPQ